MTFNKYSSQIAFVSFAVAVGEGEPEPQKYHCLTSIGNWRNQAGIYLYNFKIKKMKLKVISHIIIISLIIIYWQDAVKAQGKTLQSGIYMLKLFNSQL
jgi:hypothetical protein